MLIDGLVTTATRALLAREYIEKVATVREYCGTEIDKRGDELRELAEQVRHLEVQHAEASSELAEAEAARGEVIKSVRPEADGHRPADLARTRRLREQAREIERLRGQARRLQEAIRTAQQREARLHAQIEAFRRRAWDARYRLEATFNRERALYDQALLDRHPQAELVQPMLDESVPEIASWQYEMGAALFRDSYFPCRERRLWC